MSSGRLPGLLPVGSSLGYAGVNGIEMLAASHRVIAVELQAHGHTADIDRELSLEQQADDASATTQRRG
jgi:hypothetical protein